MYATTNRTEKIASIIDQRRPLAQKIQGVETNLRSLSSALSHLEDHCDRLLTRFDDENARKRLQEIDFTAIQKKISAESAKLNNLRERFSRRTLNIGVVGLMGQGKSTLLKSLSGLTDNEIPALEGAACTAVRSKIENQPGETIVEVTFHSQDSFLQEVIHPYYKALGLTDKPISLDDFAHKQFPPIQAGATNEEMYKHLRDDYHANLKHYQLLLKPGKPQTQRISKEEISEYVTQKRDVNTHKLLTFKHLAVQEVKIFCPFKTSDVGKIALVDVPGLGDSKLGDEDLMLKTLGQEVDVVLFIRRPDKYRYQWQPVDTQLYDKASEALNNLPNRSFMILNHCRGINNLNACQNLRNKLDTIKVVSCEIADCSDADDANVIFDLVLNYLVNNIESLDANFAASCQEEIIQLQKAVKAELAKAKNACKEVADEGDSTFDDLFDDFWDEMTNNLTELLNERIKKRDFQDDSLKQEITKLFESCRQDTGIPTIEQIQKRANNVGSYLTAYSDYLDAIRTHLSKKFLSLDSGLKHSIEEIKSQVTDVLVEKAHLGGLTDARGSEFITVIAEQIPENLTSLKEGFEILSEFQLSYRGLIQHRIRKHLDKLTPNSAIPLPQNPSAQDVLVTLEEVYPGVIYQCENALEDFLTEPSQAAFAIVEEFTDRVMRAENVKKDWRKFLRQFRTQVWPDKFQNLAEQNRLIRDWLYLVEQAININESPNQQFLN
jgi:energy-coupling factor transporter ATP-binding protein EcfA2